MRAGQYLVHGLPHDAGIARQGGSRACRGRRSVGLLSGIVLNTTKPYQIDDWIAIDGTEGRVLGHLVEMADGSGVTARIEYDHVPRLPSKPQQKHYAA